MRYTWGFNVVVLEALIFVLVGCGNPTADKPAAVLSEAVQIDDAAETAQEGSGAEGDAPVVIYTFTEDSGIDFEGYKVTGPHVSFPTAFGTTTSTTSTARA